VQATVAEPFLAFVLELLPEKITALLLETAPAGNLRPGAVDVTPTGIAVRDASPALIDAIGRLLALLDAPENAAALAAWSAKSCGGSRPVRKGRPCGRSGWPTAGSRTSPGRSARAAITPAKRCESTSSPR
jgi:hypothetical protein